VALPTPSSQLGTLRWRPAVTVRGGQVATADLRLDAPRRITPTAGARVELGAETLVEQGEPYPGRARRQPFSLIAPRRDPIILDSLAGTVKPAPPERSATGVLSAPAEGGPYPTVVIIYPGLPTWEAISVAMAGGGFTVIAFTPLNFLT
jgi:hypothetical protein